MTFSRSSEFKRMRGSENIVGVIQKDLKYDVVDFPDYGESAASLK